MGLKELTLEEKRSAIMNVLFIMVADSQYTQEELKFVFNVVAKRVGANKEEVVDIIKNFQNCKYVVPTSVEERRFQLLDMITVMSMDRNIREQEKDACIHIARIMGFNPLKVSEIIAKAEHSINKGGFLEDIALEAKEAILSELTEKAEHSICEEYDIKDILIGVKEAIWKAPRDMTLSESIASDRLSEKITWSKFQKKRYSRIILNPTTPLGRAVKMIKKLGKKKKPWAYNLLLELEKTVKNESITHDEIIRAISKRGDQCAFDYIKNILNDNPDYPTKMSCYHSLKYFRNDHRNRSEIISLLLHSLSDWDKRWWYEDFRKIAKTLESMNWEPQTKQEEVKLLLAKGNLNDINALDKDMVIALFEELESKWNSMSDYDSRKNLFLEILKKVANKDTLPNLWNLTQIGSKVLAVDVFRVIISIDDPQIGEYIALACKDKNKLLVREALRTIRGSRRHYYRKKYFSVVEQLCKDENHYRDALDAFRSLAKLEDKDSVIRLIPSGNNLTGQSNLSSQDKYAISTTVQVIRKIGAQHFVNELTELLNHPRSEVRRWAIHFLRDAGCKEAAGKIVNSLKNPDIDINERWEALGYFEKYPDRCAYETLCEIYKMHKDIMAAKAIANFPSAQTATLLWSAMENINVDGDKKQQEKWINEGAKIFSNLLDNVIQSIPDSIPKEVLAGILQLPQKISCVRESWDSDDYNTRVYRTEVTVDFSTLKKHAREIYDVYHLY